MCFSPTASFTTSFVLIIIAIATFRLVTSSQQIMLAAVPFLFSLQQLTEGIIWLILRYDWFNTSMLLSTTYLYLFFAFGIWPSWIPFSLSLLEKNSLRKKMLMIIGLFGVVLSSLLLSNMVRFGISPKIVRSNISYSSPLDFTIATYYFSVSYIIVTLLGYFISTLPYMWIFGCAIAGSCAISFFWYYHAMGSVWCFFAALLSIATYWLIYYYNKKHY